MLELMSERIDRRIKTLKIKSESAACKKAGIHIDAIRNIRNGNMPGIDKVLALSIALECPITYLIEEAWPEPEQGLPLIFDENHLVRVLGDVLSFLRDEDLLDDLPAEDVAFLFLQTYHGLEDESDQTPRTRLYRELLKLLKRRGSLVKPQSLDDKNDQG